MEGELTNFKIFPILTEMLVRLNRY